MSEQYSCFLHGDHTEEQCPKCNASLSSNERLVDWLRNFHDEHGMTWDKLHEAADEIERLRAALRWYAGDVQKGGRAREALAEQQVETTVCVAPASAGFTASTSTDADSGQGQTRPFENSTDNERKDR